MNRYITIDEIKQRLDSLAEEFSCKVVVTEGNGGFNKVWCISLDPIDLKWTPDQGYIADFKMQYGYEPSESEMYHEYDAGLYHELQEKVKQLFSEKCFTINDWEISTEYQYVEFNIEQSLLASDSVKSSSNNTNSTNNQVHNLFKEDTAYCYLSYDGKENVVDIDLQKHPDIQSVIDHVKQITSKVDANVIVFGNINGKDFFASNNGDTVDFIFRYLDAEYYNDWQEIVDDFESEVNDEYPTFESDGYMDGESTFNWVPENEYNYDDDEPTESGWESIADDFIETVENNIVEKYPICITNISKSDFDDIEYTSLKVRFEIEPYCKKVLKLK